MPLQQNILWGSNIYIYIYKKILKSHSMWSVMDRFNAIKSIQPEKLDSVSLSNSLIRGRDTYFPNMSLEKNAIKIRDWTKEILYVPTYKTHQTPWSKAIFITSAERRWLCFHLFWFFVCLSVSLCVSNITEKRVNGFSWNLQGKWNLVQGTIWEVFGMFYWTPWTQENFSHIFGEIRVC